MKHKIFSEITTFAVITIFVYAAISKLLAYDKFVAQIGQSPLLTGFGSTLAWLVIGAELVIAVLLVIRRTHVIGLYASFSLMVMFTVYILTILNFSPYVPCSCGGLLESMRWTEHVVFNSVVIVMLAVSIVTTSTHQAHIA